MATRHPKIPAEIDAELTPKARRFFHRLIDDYERRIRDLEAKLLQLERQVQKLTPQNSSLPPSTQHPHARAEKPKSGKRLKRGGQPGHPRATRPLIPSKDCDQVFPLVPKQCRKCQAPLSGTDREPLRHQVYEIPVIKPIVTEYQQHRLTCRCCGLQNCAPLPKGVPTGQSGPRLLAFTGLLMGHFRQSKRRAALFLEDLLNVPCCAATTVKMQGRVSVALEETYEELRGELESQPQLSMDETPTKQGPQKAWLWVAVAKSFAVFAIFNNRKATALPHLLGETFAGVINCDRAKMYWRARKLQWCWAHLKRDFQKLKDHTDGQAKRLGCDLLRQVNLMFVLWKRYKTGELQWQTFQVQMRPIRHEVNSLLLRGRYSGNRHFNGICLELYRNRQWLWTFTRQQGIEPTNNTSERALRPAVIYRKLSFGTQSAGGSRFIERMLTIAETCRLQNRSVFEFLTQTMEAHLNGKAAPSLLPKPQSKSDNHPKQSPKSQAA